MDDSSNVQRCSKKFYEGEEILNNVTPDRRATEEEFQNFLHRATEVEKIVNMLASNDPNEQRCGQMLADEILEKKGEKNIDENAELKIKSNRTVINKSLQDEDTSDPNKMSQEIFKRTVEKDAQERAENRKMRNERAETMKRIGNGAFKEGDYEKAVTYYSKGIEQRKDSSVLWNNRALSYMQLGLYERALSDCEWALKVNESNLKALLNSAKCWKYLGNDAKCEEFIELAKRKNQHFSKFIDDFQKELSTVDGTAFGQ